jgi:hypothetical protein
MKPVACLGELGSLGQSHVCLLSPQSGGSAHGDVGVVKSLLDSLSARRHSLH